MAEKIIFLVGPTGVGKTALSLSLAKAIDAQIISMDSMQVYRGMDIGTAKATKEEREEIVHYLLDVADPGDRFTAEDYQGLAYQAIQEIRKEKKVPLFVGGTGLYMDAILHDFQFGGVNINEDLREKLHADYDREGGQALLDRLAEVDPLTARTLFPGDRKKIIRALEIFHTTGKPMSEKKREEALSSRWDPLIFILEKDRQDLYRAIDQRVLSMVDEGLLEENRRLREKGWPRKSQAASAIGYQEVGWYFRGLVTKKEMVRLIQQFSRNYAKRQVTWFKRYKEAYHFSLNEDRDREEVLETMVELANNFLEKESTK
ncbi:MAG: tRNA (adenosine(37)-N6)-dimethylallyltransferase MiaA [Firmicutes bacterium]|nr:tRNA (adenosine(37)-N6)-dimethylallyltransferase MiaA [Bacillota bacterium]